MYKVLNENKSVTIVILNEAVLNTFNPLFLSFLEIGTIFKLVELLHTKYWILTSDRQIMPLMTQSFDEETSEELITVDTITNRADLVSYGVGTEIRYGNSGQARIKITPNNNTTYKLKKAAGYGSIVVLGIGGIITSTTWGGSGSPLDTEAETYIHTDGEEEMYIIIDKTGSFFTEETGVQEVLSNISLKEVYD